MDEYLVIFKNGQKPYREVSYKMKTFFNCCLVLMLCCNITAPKIKAGWSFRNMLHPAALSSAFLTSVVWCRRLLFVTHFFYIKLCFHLLFCSKSCHLYFFWIATHILAYYTVGNWSLLVTYRCFHPLYWDFCCLIAKVPHLNIFIKVRRS